MVLFESLLKDEAKHRYLAIKVVPDCVQIQLPYSSYLKSLSVDYDSERSEIREPLTNVERVEVHVWFFGMLVSSRDKLLATEHGKLVAEYVFADDDYIRIVACPAHVEVSFSAKLWWRFMSIFVSGDADIECAYSRGIKKLPSDALYFVQGNGTFRCNMTIDINDRWSIRIKPEKNAVLEMGKDFNTIQITKTLRELTIKRNNYARCEIALPHAIMPK